MNKKQLQYAWRDTTTAGCLIRGVKAHCEPEHLWLADQCRIIDMAILAMQEKFRSMSDEARQK